jgi:predicted metal-dependent hydrolase
LRDSAERPKAPPRHGGDPPDYRIRVSARARQVRLVVTPERGLEVVIPRRFDRRRIPALVEDKKDWIERATARVEARRRRLRADPPRLPDTISLPALDEVWDVEYRPAVTAAVGTGRPSLAAVAREHPGQRLVVGGNADDAEACKAALCRWLRRRAEQTLVARLEQLAGEVGLGYTRASVRQQRTRWGSCSRQGTVSLNVRLLFLPARMVDYVLLHELCHTVEMNHSPRFWKLLQSIDRDCEAQKKSLKSAGTLVPTWVDHQIEEPAV